MTVKQSCKGKLVVLMSLLIFAFGLMVSVARSGETSKDLTGSQPAADCVALKKWAEYAAGNQPEKADTEWRKVVASMSNASDMDEVVQAAVDEYRFASGGIVKPAARFSMVKHLSDLTEKQVGASHLLAASTHSFVADEHEKLNEFEPALKLRRQVVEIRQRRLGAENPVTLKTNDKLARLLIEMGKVGEAQEIIKRNTIAYKKQRNTAGLERITILNSRINIAVGKRAVKPTGYENAIDIEAVRKATLSKDFENWLAAYNRGDMKGAETLWIKLLIPLKHCDQIMDLLTRARESADWNSPGLVAPDVKLLQLLMHLQNASVKAFGPNHPAIAGSCRQIADYYFYRKKHKESSYWWQKKVDILKHNFGMKDHDTIYSMVFLAKEYEASGNYDAAMKTVKESIEFCKYNNNPQELQRNQQELKRLSFNLQKTQQKRSMK
jgi:tetratricopeptide (TPR) repeat protein